MAQGERRESLRQILKEVLPAEYEAFEDDDCDNLIRRRFTKLGMLRNAGALKTLRNGPDPLPEALVCALESAAEKGVQFKPKSKRSRGCFATAEIGVLTKGLVKRRKLELEQAGQAGEGVFEAGWSILPQAEPLGTRDMRFLVVKAQEKLGVAVMGRSHFRALVDRALALINATLSRGGLARGGKRILMHGPAGFGKTHLLLQLIVYLTAALDGTGKRVAPMLDCAYFKADRVEAMKQALAWAYSGEEEIIDKIASLDSMESVKEFLNGREEELLFCLDQYQELGTAKEELDACLYHFRTIVVTSAGEEELRKESDTLHKLASMFPVHSGLSEEEQMSYNLMYGTDCSTPAVQQLVMEKLEGVAGCLADWHEAYHGRSPENYSVPKVFGASPTFQVRCLEPVKEGEPLSKHDGIGAAEVLRDGRTLNSGPTGSEARQSETPGSVTKGEAQGEACESGEGGKERAPGLRAAQADREDLIEADSAASQRKAYEATVKALRQAAGPEALEEAGPSTVDAGGAGAIKSEGHREKEVAEGEQTSEKAERDWEAWERFLECDRVVQITRSLEQIYDRVKAEGGQKVQKWLAQMMKMVCSDSFVGFELTKWEDIDLRNVAVEGLKVRPAFPLVREAIAHFVEQVQGRAVFYSDVRVWATLMSELEGERVPAVAGLLAERCAIGAIVDGGGYKAVLQQADAQQVKLVFFERDAERPAVLTELTEFQKSGLETRIACFVPRTPFYPAMDMAIVVFKRQDQQLGSVERLTKVQMTLQSAEEHGRSSQTAMHISNVKPWLGDTELESVKMAFCYIVPGGLVAGGLSPYIKQKPAQLGSSRAQAGSVQIVAHHHIEIAFGDLDPRLGLVDKWKRGGS